MTGVVVRLLAAWAAGALAGCQGSPRAGEPSDTGFVERESGVVVGAMEARGSVAAAMVWGSAEGEAPVVVRAAGGGEYAATRRVSVRGAAERVVELIGEEGAVTSAATLVLERGGVAVRAHEGDGIASAFEPAAPFVPEELAAGEELRSSFEVTATGERIGRGMGRGTVVVRGVGLQRVRAGGGEFEAFVVTTLTDFSIGPARVELTRRAWVDTGPRRGGVVAEETRQRVRVLGITVSASERSWVMAGGGAG